MSTLILSRSDISKVLTMAECIAAVEAAFRAHAEGKTVPPEVLGSHVEGGGFHVKTAGMRTTRSYFVAKVNANFPANPQRHGRPTVQGALILFDGGNGEPLAIMDSAEITRLRTAAASAVAAKYLARREATVMTICGAGLQGRAHLDAMLCVRDIRQVFVYDKLAGSASRFVDEMSPTAKTSITAVSDFAEATIQSDVVVTCTSSTKAFLASEHVRPGTFIAAVGADSDHKQEIAPSLLGRATIVADILEQCALIGDLHHAIDSGVLKKSDVHAELADVVVGRKPGRVRKDEITIFDSTGTALEDVAAAAWAYERSSGTRTVALAD